MSSAHYLLGDTRTVVDTLPEGCIDLVLTSPPFLALRSYLPADHPDKHAEIGSEATPAAFLDVLLDLTARWARVLAPTGSIAVELGDTYSGSGGSGGDYRDGHLREGQAKWSGSAAKRRRLGQDDNDRPSRTGRNGNTLAHAAKDTWASSDNRDGWPLAKCKAMIPELYRVALAYGINPLTGAESPAGRWRVRNVVTWYRPNPTVGALSDKYRPATSDIVVATRAKDRWFDLDAVRTEPKHGYVAKNKTPSSRTQAPGQPQRLTNPEAPEGGVLECNPAGAPPHDMWEIPTVPYSGAHYAVYPPALCETPIKSMVPLEVCRTCGTPRRRLVETTNAAGIGFARHGADGVPGHERAGDKSADQPTAAIRETLGWTDCGCGTPDYRPGVVLDPFGGTGTTAAVATGHGRHAICIDIDERNLDLARERIGGLMLTEGVELPEWLKRG